MAINYTNNLGLPQIDYLHDGEEGSNALKTGMAILDSLIDYIVVNAGDVVTNNGKVVINTPL